jgi:hypothetical protein
MAVALCLAALELLAYRFAFDADATWHDSSNAELRQLRPDPTDPEMNF